MSDFMTNSPYRVGTSLYLQVEGDSPFQTGQDGFLAVEITDIISPSTFSLVLRVLVAARPGLTKPAILKLFDRRFAAQLRNEADVGPWTSKLDGDYRTCIRSGDAAWLIAKLSDPSTDIENLEGGWTDGRNETYLFDKCRYYYNSEASVYETMKDLQGKGIPELYCKVRIDRPSFHKEDSQATTGVTKDELDSWTEDEKKYFEIPGLLMEYIDGFTLCDIEQNAPEEHWQAIVDEAIRIVAAISFRDILNSDVRPANWLIRKRLTGDAYDVFQIDFGHCRFRELEESDDDWKRAKWSEDEEGCVGYVMQKRLRGKINFEHSMNFLPPPEDESDEEREGESTGQGGKYE